MGSSEDHRYTPDRADLEGPPHVAWPHWTCPDHGDERIAEAVSQRGRDFRTCLVKDCGKYEHF